MEIKHLEKELGFEACLAQPQLIDDLIDMFYAQVWDASLKECNGLRRAAVVADGEVQSNVSGGDGRTCNGLH